MYGLTKADYRDALLAQDAVNLSGVVHSWAAVLSKMVHNGADTKAKNTHPISILYACKVADMTGLGIYNDHVFSVAYEACKDALLASPTEIPD